MTTANPSAEIAATLAKLAALMAEQQPQGNATPEQQPRALPERVLLTVDEAAQQLRIGRTKAYALVKTGELESVHIGRLRRVPKEAVQNYAAHLTHKQNTA